MQHLTLTESDHRVVRIRPEDSQTRGCEIRGVQLRSEAVGQVPLSACACILNVPPGHNTERGDKLPDLASICLQKVK
jgi:hypothetical protein